MTQLVQAEQGVAVAWERDLRVAYRGYQIHAIFCGNPRIAPEGNQQIWQLADQLGRRYGGWVQSYSEAAAAIDSNVEQDVRDAYADWYAGADWNSQLEQPLGATLDEETQDLVFRNHGAPGAARDAALAYYTQLCKEPGAAGTCYYGRMLANGEQEDAEDTTERDPAQEEEYRQEQQERYLEEHAEAHAWQDRYEAHLAER